MLSSKNFLVIGLGIAIFYVTMVGSIVNTTGTFVDEQALLMDKFSKRELGENEYHKLSKQSERNYRNEVADKLELFSQKYNEVAEIVYKVAPPDTNLTQNLSMISGNLTKGIKELRED